MVVAASGVYMHVVTNSAIPHTPRKFIFGCYTICGGEVLVIAVWFKMTFTRQHDSESQEKLIILRVKTKIEHLLLNIPERSAYLEKRPNLHELIIIKTNCSILSSLGPLHENSSAVPDLSFLVFFILMF